MCVCVTHSHKTQDKSLIKKIEIYMCCCRPISGVNFDEKLTLCDLYKKRYCCLSIRYGVTF